MKKQSVIPLLFDSYFAVIKNSVGSKTFRNFYAEVGGRKKDILENGDLSCAFYVSSILVLFKLIGGTHTTVRSTVEDLKKLGWKTIKKPKIGSVLVWEKIDFGKDESHAHIGFYIGHDQAISNSSKLRYPIQHHWNFKSKRKVDLILWNPKLN